MTVFRSYKSRSSRYGRLANAAFPGIEDYAHRGCLTITFGKKSLSAFGAIQRFPERSLARTSITV
jgi:hypothetical protein